MRVHWTWCKPSKYCCVPSRDRQNWWKRFNLQCPRFFQLPYHLLSNSNFDFRCFLFFFFPSLFLLKLNAIEFWTKSSLILIQCWIPFIPVYFLFVWFVLSSSFVSFSCSFLPFSFCCFKCPFCSTFLFPFLSWSSKCSNVAKTLAITYCSDNILLKNGLRTRDRLIWSQQEEGLNKKVNRFNTRPSGCIETWEA